MPENVVYTALYDLNRGNFDGRSLDIYKRWLSQTIELFPNIVIFHGGELDDFPSVNCQLVKVPLETLKVHDLLPKVERILNNFSPPSPNDITFKMPLYSLIQFAKFELPQYLPDSWDSALWVDAGISRFVSSIETNAIVKNTDYLLEKKYDALFEVDIRNNFKFRKFCIRDSQAGTCKKVLSGGAFWLSNFGNQKISDLLATPIDTWINLGIWDNEQVMLRNVLPSQKIRALYIPQVSGVPGTVARVLGTSKVSRHLLGSQLIEAMLSRGRDIY